MNDDLHSILTKIAQNQGSPYKSVKLINDTLIIVLNDGQIITKFGATKEDFNAVVECKTKTEIKNNIKTDAYHELEKIVNNSEMKKTIKNRINKIN
jgi:predicted house-cleaning noncanonical NTP pyrophosphatase (MazG superfamily)